MSSRFIHRRCRNKTYPHLNMCLSVGNARGRGVVRFSRENDTHENVCVDGMDVK